VFARTGPFIQPEGLTLLAQTAEEGGRFSPARRDGLEECSVGLKAEGGRIGRDPGEIEISTGSIPTLDEVKRLEDMGVSRFTVGPPGFTPDALREGLEKLGNELISKS